MLFGKDCFRDAHDYNKHISRCNSCEKTTCTKRMPKCRETVKRSTTSVSVYRKACNTCNRKFDTHCYNKHIPDAAAAN